MTKQEAINAKCKDCNYDELDKGTWREQVESCKATDCSLWEFRPITAATRKKRTDERVAAMTDEEREVYYSRLSKLHGVKESNS
jgi:hypothetical protein